MYLWTCKHNIHNSTHTSGEREGEGERARERGEITPNFRRMPLGSVVTSQPSLQPGTTHLFDIDPRVTTGTIDPNAPMGTNGLLPKVRW